MNEKTRRLSFGIPSLDIENNIDGTIIIKNIIQPDDWPNNIIEKLIFWAQKKPKKIFLAQRNKSLSWDKLSYEETLSKVNSLSYFLLKQGLSKNKPVII